MSSKRQEPKYKINRRLQVNLWGRPKSPLNRREYGPGQHGQRRKKPSDFGTQLAAKQKLMDAAKIQAQQMAKYQLADHTISGATYPTLQSRLQAVGYSYSSAAENVAWNQRDAQSVVNGWMTSAAHRANILDPYLKEIGAAMVRSSKGEPYWIQVFGTPR